MLAVKVSTVHEVFEQLRLDIVCQLEADGFELPPEAKVTGNCERALDAWLRLQHRAVTSEQRTVRESIELERRTLDPDIRVALAAIRSELEQGDDLTHRLTRNFYRTGFNDFLLNTFGIQHLHLGAPGAGRDRTRQHAMSGSGNALLFAVFEQRAAYFIDVLDHDVFDSPEKAKSLVQVVLRNWPDLFQRYRIAGFESSELSFQEAFRGAKAGFTTLFEIDGVVFARGTVRDGRMVNGRRTSCTSIDVVDAANRILTLVTEIVKYVEGERERLADTVESQRGVRPSEFRLEVVEAGPVVFMRDQNSGMKFCHNGQKCGCILSSWRIEKKASSDGSGEAV